MTTFDSPVTEPRPLRNWSGNVEFTADRLLRPTTIEQLQEMIAGSERLRVLGTGHSFNRIADTPGALVSLSDLPRTIDVDPKGSTVRVAAGVRYAELTSALQERGLALHNLGSLPHISVAGACATATHGSGQANGNLSSAVRGLETIDAAGERVALSRDFDGDRFCGHVVALGALGAVTHLTLKVQASYDVRQYVYERLPIEQLREHFSDIAGSAYSVSLFTTWRTPAIDQVWVKERIGDDPPVAWPRKWYGATLANGPRHPIANMPTGHCTTQLGEPGPWNERLPHFRAEFTPSAGDELQSEYLVASNDAVDAIDALERIRDAISPLVLISEIRTIASDGLWLSPSYERATVAFHFTWVNDPGRVMHVLPLVEHALAPFGARPHWGKLFAIDPSAVRALYERSGEFVDLVAKVDPGGKFRNAFLDAYFPSPTK